MLSPDMSTVVTATRGRGVETGVGEEGTCAVGTRVATGTVVDVTAVSVGCATAVPAGTNAGVAVGCVRTTAVNETTGVESRLDTCSFSWPLVEKKPIKPRTSTTNTTVKTINDLRLMGIPPQ